MEVRYQLEPTDLEALTAFVNRGTLLGWVLRRMHWVGVAVMVVFAGYVFDPRSPVMTGTAVLAFAVSLVVFWRRRHKGVRGRGKALFVPTTLVLSPEGLQTLATGRSSTTAWSEVRGYGETPEHVFVTLDGVSAFIVPKRCLSTEDVQGLVAELDRYTHRLPPPPVATGRLVRMAILGMALLAVIVLAWYFAALQKPR